MNSKLYVGNLSAGITENSLRDLFSGKGPVINITLMVEPSTGHSRGFAFVTMATPEAATTAMKMLHSYSLGGRHITVTEARPPQEAQPGTLIGDGNFRGFAPLRKPARKSRRRTSHNKSHSRTANVPSFQRRSDSAQRILVVDDEPFIRDFCAEILCHFGYGVDLAENGAHAWETLQHKKYDLLITDHNMSGLTGVELIQKLYDAEISLPVIMISALMPTAELNQRPELRLVPKLPKPFTAASLLALVRRTLATIPQPSPGLLVA